MEPTTEKAPPSALSPALQRVLFTAGLITDTQTTCSNVDDTIESHPTMVRVDIDNGFIEFGKQDKAKSGSFLDTNYTDSNYYELCVKCLSPLFKKSESILSQMDEENFKQKYGSSFTWTSSQDLFLEVHSLLVQNDNSQDLLALLLVCCRLERSLGNLFLLKGTQCPAMLKDLLVTPELCEILGLVPLQVLQVVMGPPISMNIRNVAWHGFLADGELPRRYICFLLLLTASLGKLLNDKGYGTASIPVRDNFPLTRVEKVASQFSDFHEEDFCCVEWALSNSWLVDKSNRTLFNLAFQFLRSREYGKSAVLLIPLLEHTFRKLFVKVNNCSSRLITAETTTLFTTFEEILEPNLPDGQVNRIIQHLGEPCMDLLHDLLVYPSGPRCRDKLSHGEADHRDVAVSLPRTLLVVLAWLVIEDSGDQGFKQKITECMGSYRSVFHPVALLQEKIVELAQQSHKLQAEVTLTPALDSWNKADGLQEFTRDNPVLNKAMTSLTRFADRIFVKIPQNSKAIWENLKESFSIPFTDSRDLVKEVLRSINIKTLYRWKTSNQQENLRVTSAQTSNDSIRGTQAQGKSQRPTTGSVSESEVVGLLTRLAAEATTCLTQTGAALVLRRTQLEGKQLRSRQRDNFKRLLLFVPCTGLISGYVIYLATWIISNLDNFTSLSQDQRTALQKHLRSTLQAVENIRTFTSPDKNKWTEAGDLLLSELNAACDRVEKASFFKNVLQ